jgi:N-formylglutamate amidohydrolase
MTYFKMHDPGKCPVICNIPHSSIAITRQFQKDFLIDDDALKKEASKLADLYVEELFEPLLKNFGGIISKISRLVVDTERFDNDDLEAMSKVGMGVLYEKSTEGKIIRKLSKERKKEVLGLIYYPYHKNLETLVNNCLEKFGKCLILDCHSFPESPRSYEPDQDERDHDICLGTSSFHTPRKLFNIFKRNFEKNGFKIKQNIPFSGTIVPAKYFNKNKNVFSIMIEVNRKLYTDKNDFSTKPGFSGISSKICYTTNKSALDFLGLKS